VEQLIRSNNFPNEESALDAFSKFLSLKLGDYVAVNNTGHGLFGVGVVASGYRFEDRRHDSFGFLGFEFRRVRSRAGRWMPLRTPLLKKRTALLRELKVWFRRYRSQPTQALVTRINPILRGWFNHFSYGHSSRCLSFIRNWVEQKIRRHLARARLRQGFGWKRWSRRWMYESLGLFDDYRVRYLVSLPKVAPARRSHNP
jgi:hypothetical protein